MHHRAPEGWSALTRGKEDWRARGVVCSRTEGREGRGAQGRTARSPRGTSTCGSACRQSEESEPYHGIASAIACLVEEKWGMVVGERRERSNGWRKGPFYSSGRNG
jgi:hypothetical protein